MTSFVEQNHGAMGDSIGEVVYPLALLMDELKHDDVGNRVKAMERLDTIAIALGPERARDELLQFLFEVAHDDEDEVFSVLATKLNGDFVPFIGGDQYAKYLLPTLEFLCSIEEPVVRSNAIQSLSEVAGHLSLEDLNTDFLAVIDNLTNAEWFSSRVSACGLYKCAINRVSNENRKQLLKLYLKKLVNDDPPMVRRAAASSLPLIIKSLEELESTVEKHLDAGKYDLTHQTPSTTDDWEIIFELFNRFVNDDQDSVKFLSVEIIISIAHFFNKIRNDKSHNDLLLEKFLKLAEDESWRVRYMVSEKFAKVAEYFDEKDLNDKILAKFVWLLKDREAEVRKSISKQIPDFGKLIEKQNIIDKIIPQVEELISDQNEFVRTALATNIAGLAPILGEKPTSDYLLNIFLEMLNDEYPDVRLNIIKNLSTVNDVIGIKILSTALLPAITELAKDKQWRVRLAIIEYIPLLSKQLGIEFFNNVLNSLCMSWLWDSVYTIREAAVLNLKRLAEVFGDAWAKEEIIDKIANNKILNDYRKENPDMFPDTMNDGNEDSEIIEGANWENVNSSIMNNFIYRLTCLFTLISLVEVLEDDNLIINEVLDCMNNLANDSVPNITFNVAKGYKTVVFRLLRLERTEVKPRSKDSQLRKNQLALSNPEEEEELIETQELKEDTYKSKLTSEEEIKKMTNVIKEKIIPHLMVLAEDRDIDVQFFAKKSLNEIKLALGKLGITL